ncbi:hemicentin-2-like [Pomacea canaliculata]|uniref:hemicentin-2-like n=1 Tax=Pomacea canaliculata TaxID=400727 RepID=UPI000D737C73|nr:hemicentin-2-like [Pomacea canaliculata]
MALRVESQLPRLAPRGLVRVSGMWVSLWLLSFFAPTEVRAARLATTQLDITLQPGHSAYVTLTCTVRDIGKEKVIWRRLSDPIPIAVGTRTFWPGSKYRVGRNGDDWQLIINKLKVTDAGEYECRLSGTSNQAEILSLIIPASGYPYFSTTKTTIETKLGATATLPCHVENIGNYMVLWQNGDRKVLSLKKKVYSGDRRMHVVHNSPKEWSLRIAGVTREDLGVYTCVVNTAPFLTRTVHLTHASNSTGPESQGSVATSSPRLETDTFQKNVEVKQGHSVTLRCHFTGQPSPQITWSRRVWKGDTKQTEDLKVAGATLELRDVQPQDKGLYVCRADNGVAPVAVGKISVKVTEEITTSTTTASTAQTTPFNPETDASPRVFAESSVVYQRRGRHAELRCRAVGIPRPEVFWLFNNQPITSGSAHEVTSTEHAHHTVHTTLLLRSVEATNFGNYVCYARNVHGSDSTTVQLAAQV